MALEHFTRAWESKSFQRQLLAVAPLTIKAAVQATEEYLAVSESEHTPQAMPVEQTELPTQPSALEISLKAMTEAVTQQTMLLQRVVEKIEQRPAKQQKGCFKCGGPHMQRDCPQGNKQQPATTPTTAANGQDGWTVVKRKHRGRRQAVRQSEKLAEDSQAKVEPRAPPQQAETETQPVESLKATQETPSPSPTSQRRHPFRRQRRKRHTEQQEVKAIQRQPGSEVESSPVDVPAVPVTETLPPRRWERADLHTEAASCNSPRSPPAGPASCMPAGLSRNQQVTTRAVTYIGSLFVPGRVAGKSLSFLVDTGCTHNLVFRTVFDRLPAQTRQQMVYGDTVVAMADGSGLHIYGGIGLTGRLRMCHLKPSSWSAVYLRMPSWEWSFSVAMTAQ